jgi:hypothetical protein
MSALEKLLDLTGAQPPLTGLDEELLLAAQVAARELTQLLSLADDEDDDDGDKGGDDDSGGHADHPTYKALVKKNVDPKRAAAMCARSDKKVRASQLAAAVSVILAGKPGEDISLVTLAAPAGESAAERRQSAREGNALPDGTYPIPDKKHLHSAAVLAASKHGNWKGAQSLIRKRARELGVDLKSLPGFGGQSDDDGEKAAASMLELARRDAGDGGVPMNHGPWTGTHTHTHFQSGAHAHEHQHVNDNSHDGGALHRPGSSPSRPGW